MSAIVCRRISLLPRSAFRPQAHIRVFTTASKAPTPAPSNPTTDAIHRISLRTGLITHCTPHPDADKLLVSTISLGAENTRTIVSGIRKWYHPDDLMGTKVVVVENLKKAKLRGVESHGMLLAASKDEMVQLLRPAEESVVGDRIFIDGLPNDTNTVPDPTLNPKRKVFESVQPYLRTDRDGIATYKNMKLRNTTGVVTCALPDAEIS
ncbi:hypothetical protein BC832DRAFT_132086 [Gaertneriomyces semiglobifer]|nr:hypothetical protein BC832DRAFT_132086 [Gaertneriomyces semiglobifer]